MYDDYDEYQDRQDRKDRDENRRDSDNDKKKKSRKKKREDHSKMHVFADGDIARDILTGSKVLVLSQNRGGKVPQYRVKDIGTTCQHPCIHNAPGFNLVPIKQ